MQKGSLSRGPSPFSNLLFQHGLVSDKRVRQNTGMKIGYARVSTDDQHLDLQRAALKAAGCERVFEDQGLSGVAITRPGLESALAAVGEGDVLVVWKLDRLGRSLASLIGLIDDLGKQGAGFQSLSEHIDTTTAGGRLIFHVMGALAEFERSLIWERTKAGMQTAKCRDVLPANSRRINSPAPGSRNCSASMWRR